MTEKVYAAIAAVTRRASQLGIEKGRTAQMGNAGKYQFRGVDEVFQTMSALLSAENLTVLPEVLDYEQSMIQGANGRSMTRIKLVMGYGLVADDGSTVRGSVAAESMDSGDKATAKAMSAAYRTFLLQTFVVPFTGHPEPDDQNYDINEAGVTHAGPAVQFDDVASEIAGVIPTIDDLDSLRQYWESAKTRLAAIDMDRARDWVMGEGKSVVTARIEQIKHADALR